MFSRARAGNLAQFFGSFDAVPRRDRVVLQDFVEDLRSLSKMLLGGFARSLPAANTPLPFGLDRVQECGVLRKSSPFPFVEAPGFLDLSVGPQPFNVACALSDEGLGRFAIEADLRTVDVNAANT